MAALLLEEENPVRLLGQIDANRTGFLARLGRVVAPPLPNGASAEVFRTGVASPLFNGVAAAAFPHGGADEAVGALVRWGHRTSLPWGYWVTDRDEAGRLPSTLLSYGLARWERFVGLGVLGRDAGMMHGNLPGFLVQRVTSEEDLRLLLLALGRSQLLRSASEIEALARAIEERELRADASLRWIVGLADGRPVGGAVVYVEGAVAGIYGLSVDVNCRDRRYGTALLSACLRQAAAWGCRAVVSTAPVGDMSLYARLGFEEYESLSVFAVDPREIPAYERDAL